MMPLQKLFLGVRNAFIFNKCINYSSEKAYEKAYQLSNTLKFESLGLDMYIQMVLYKGYAAHVTNRFSEAAQMYNLFLDNVEHTSRYNQDEVRYLKKYAAINYLRVERYVEVNQALKDKLRALSNEHAIDRSNVSKRLMRIFII